MLKYVFVFVGGGIGASVRYWMTGIVYKIIQNEFPYGTLLVNTIGCFLIGILIVGMEERFVIGTSLRIFLTIGVLGGFTTFSTFSYETIALFRDGEILFAFMNVLVSVIICLTATYVGIIIAKLF